MSRSHPHHVSIGNKLKGLLTMSHPSELALILDTMVYASSPYPSLQEAASGLLKVLMKVEVCPSLSPAVSQGH